MLDSERKLVRRKAVSYVAIAVHQRLLLCLELHRRYCVKNE